MVKPTRRESREIAFAILFEWSFKEDTLDEIIEMAKITRSLEIDDFALLLAQKTIDNKDELDALIELYLKGWKLSRISRTALAILRQSFCELTRFDDIPAGVSINEAVELSKKYGTDEEAAYLNGILGSFERVRKGEIDPPKPKVEEKQQAIEDEVLNIQDEQDTQHTDNSIDSKKPYDIELIDDIVIEVD